MLKWLKRLKFLVPIVVVLVLIVGAFIVLGIACRGEEVSTYEGWVKADNKQTSSALEKLNPLHKSTKADKLLKDWPAGTRIIEVEPRTEPLLIAIPPSGEILIPEGEKGVTVYEKPKRSWGMELRPFVGGGYADGPAVLAGVDVFTFKLGKQVHLGPAIAYSGDVSGGGSVAVNIWRNLDGRGYVGANLSGGVVYGAGVSIGIE